MSEALKKKEEKVFRNVQVMYVNDPNASQILLPDGMAFDTAINWLVKMRDEERRSFDWSFKFRGWFPFDAMWAVYRAMAELYGFAHVGDFKSFWGDTPPSSVTIAVGEKETIQIPWGPIEVSGVSQALVPSIEFDQGLPCLRLGAVIRNSERPIVDKIAKRAEELLKTSSIYRGKAIEVDFTVFNPRTNIMFDMERAPKFWDTQIKDSDLILPKDVFDQINTNLWVPVKHSQVCREQKIPLRRGVLLAGRYGVGKTLTARMTARICVENNWTFLYLRDLNQLQQALNFAKKYEPCVIFAEDINRVVTGERDANMDAIFNVIDGVDRKNDEVMVVFTTNDLDKIHPGMLRPGRIDTVIVVHPPDAEAAARLIHYYGRGLIAPDADVSSVGHLLAGQIPAIIRECVERSKLAAIGDTLPGQTLVVQAEHLRIAAKEMLGHAKLLEEPAKSKPDLVILAESFGKVLVEGMRAMGEVNENDHDDHVLSIVPTKLLDDAGRPNPGPANHVQDNGGHK